MTHTRRPARRGDGSAVVDGWVAFYTLGLPAPMRARRREELAGFLADEGADAVRRGEAATLRRRRLGRWFAGIPDDLLWRLTDARAVARTYPTRPWVPLSRWSAVLLASVIIGTTGAFVLVVRGLLEGVIQPAVWASPAPQAFLLACLAIGTGTVAAVPWPRLGAALVSVGAVIGFLVAPWLWGCFGLAVLAVGLRWIEARSSVIA